MSKAAFIVVPLLMAMCFLAGRHYTSGPAPGPASARRILYYVDPMHPAYKSNKPGIAPDCGMKLVPVYADGADQAGAGNGPVSMGPGTVNISPERQQLIGLRVQTIEETPSAPEVRLLGRVVADEARVYRVNVATDGYIQKVFNHTTGSLVKKDDELAEFGSTEIMTAQQSFVGASLTSPETPNDVAYPEWKNQNLLVYSSRLRALGMSDIQIKELGKSLTISDRIRIYSPVTGFILARNVSPGQRFEKGAELYRIADLSHLWILADVYEREAQSFRPGTIATVTLPNQKLSFRARVSDVPPQFDPATRTLKLRLEAENPKLVLRPDMFVDVDLPVHIPAALTVPVDALLDSGMKKRVFVDRGNGFFEPREVETGWRYGDRVQIVSGLAAGDLVVVSGMFLLDSESRLKAPRQRAMNRDNNGDTSAQPESKTAALPSSATDPSCGMNVKPAESVAAGNTEFYHGKTYYFCSASCRNKFHQDPERYLPSDAESSNRASGNRLAHD